jgi:hypothetical protein
MEGEMEVSTKIEADTLLEHLEMIFLPNFYFMDQYNLN